MKRIKGKPLAIVAVIAGLIAVFISVSNDKPTECFTWKVKINGSVFYLAGSIYAASEADYPLPEIYIDSYRKANKVIFELKDDFETTQAKVFLYAEKDKLPDGLNLGDSLKPESVRKLREIIDSAKLSKCFGYEGWLLNMFISGNKYKLCGYDTKLAIDKYFHDMAARDKKEVIGLDEIQTQLALFDFDVPFKVQIQILEKAISEMAVKAEADAELFRSYFRNDRVKFEEEFLKPYDFSNPQSKKIYDMVFTNRNKSWVEKFTDLSKRARGKYFVLVGAGHYFGPGNILELLKDKGYTVEKI